MQEQRIGKKDLQFREFFENAHSGRVPNLTVQQLYQQFMLNTTDAQGISYGLFNGVVKKIKKHKLHPEQTTNRPSPIFFRFIK